MKNVTSLLQENRIRLVVIVVLLAVAVLGVYRYADASGAEARAVSDTQAQAATDLPIASTEGGADGADACCGVGGTTTPIEGAAEIAGEVQKISVDVSGGSYNPNVVRLKAGVPAEITFGQSSGCTGYVQSDALGFQADLTAGPQTVKLPPLDPGTYDFECGMYMVFGEIVVE